MDIPEQPSIPEQPVAPEKFFTDFFGLYLAIFN